MADQRDRPDINALTQTLLGIANRSFATRVPRNFSGDDEDVLAFLVNSTADEVEILFQELDRERDQLRRAQQQLAQAEKLAALGRLAAGVAHQMNQPLTVITALVDLILMEPEQRVSEHVQNLEMVAEASRQMSAIVDSVRTFGQSRATEKKTVSALSPVTSAQKLFAADLEARGIELECVAPDGLPSIHVDMDQLRQAFINLIANARDALQNGPIRAQPARIRLSVSARDHDLVYRIEDNGPGVPPDHASRLFEPFFTTKGERSGTGLGLSVALGVIEQHGGSIKYEPSDLGGACFHIRLPGSEEAK